MRVISKNFFVNNIIYSSSLILRTLFFILSLFFISLSENISNIDTYLKILNVYQIAFIFEFGMINVFSRRLSLLFNSTNETSSLQYNFNFITSIFSKLSTLFFFIFSFILYINSNFSLESVLLISFILTASLYFHYLNLKFVIFNISIKNAQFIRFTELKIYLIAIVSILFIVLFYKLNFEFLILIIFLCEFCIYIIFNYVYDKYYKFFNFSIKNVGLSEIVNNFNILKFENTRNVFHEMFRVGGARVIYTFYTVIFILFLSHFLDQSSSISFLFSFNVIQYASLVSFYIFSNNISFFADFYKNNKVSHFIKEILKTGKYASLLFLSFMILILFIHNNLFILFNSSLNLLDIGSLILLICAFYFERLAATMTQMYALTGKIYHLRLMLLNLFLIFIFFIILFFISKEIILSFLIAFLISNMLFFFPIIFIKFKSLLKIH